MQDDLRAVLVEDALEPVGVADVADAHDRHVRVELTQFEPQLVEARLVDLDEEQLRGPQLHRLAAELRADRPGRAGDGDDLAGDRPADLLDVDRGGLAPEEVLDLDFAQVGEADAALLDDERRHDARLPPRPPRRR